MPFALPPIGVLHGMLEIFLIFNVHNKVLFLNFADDKVLFPNFAVLMRPQHLHGLCQ